MTATDSLTLSYTVTRTMTLTVDVTPDEACEARDRGETLAEFAVYIAANLPDESWTVVDETVGPT